MTLSIAFDINPAAYQQALILMDEGTIVAQGGAIDPHFTANWTPGYGQDIQVTDWTTPSGYVMESLGSIPAFGAATVITGAETGDYTQGFAIHRAISMNPAADGTGYILRCTGEIKAASTMTGLDLSSTIIWPGQDIARDVAIKWDTSGTVPRLSWYILDAYGGLHASSGAHAGTAAPDNGYSPGRDIARRLMVVDWETPIAYWVDIYGGVHRFWTSCKSPANTPTWQGYGPVKDIELVTYTPFTYEILDWNLTIHPIVASTPPTVTITAPADGSTITTTTRPAVSWGVSDAENDRVDHVTARLFSSAQYGAGGFDPTVSTPTFESIVTDMSFVGAVPDVPIPNGTWRWYVWAVEAISGYQSAIVHATFTLSVSVPSTPTVVATPDPVLPQTSVLITATTPPSGSVFVLESSVDAGATWQAVPGGSAIPAAASVTFIDRTVATHTLVSYRARIWRPDVQIDGAWSTASNVRVDIDGYWLNDPTSSADPLQISVQKTAFAEQRKVGVYLPIGQRTTVAISDVPKGIKGVATLNMYDTTMRAAVEALVRSGRTLLWRDHFGRAYYVAVSADVTYTPVLAEAEWGSTTPVRDSNDIAFEVVEVDQPV